MAFNPSEDASGYLGGEGSSANWWEGPPPPGYTGQWPPPLPPGASYGPNFGQINYAPGTGPDVQTAIDQNQWATPTQGVTDVPMPSGGSGSSEALTNTGNLPSPFTSQFNAPPTINLGGPAGIEYIPPVPQFNAPNYTPPPRFQYQPFTAPTASDVLSDPSYQFRRDQGLGAISNSEAARGLWASGQTGKAFNDYAQNFASQEYGNVYNRSLNNYLTNANQAMQAYALNAQYQNNLPYQYAFQNAQASFAPQMQQYQTQASAAQRQNELNYSNAYDKWLADYQQKLGTAGFLRDTYAL